MPQPDEKRPGGPQGPPGVKQSQGSRIPVHLKVDTTDGYCAWATFSSFIFASMSSADVAALTALSM